MSALGLTLANLSNRATARGIRTMHAMYVVSISLDGSEYRRGGLLHAPHNIPALLRTAKGEGPRPVLVVLGPDERNVGRRVDVPVPRD